MNWDLELFVFGSLTNHVLLDVMTTFASQRQLNVVVVVVVVVREQYGA
jgi:membrane-bound metal-dependent hydrolase YbcI (DUF457 family)